MSENLKEIGNRIYSLRKEKGLSRAKLGEMVALHESTVKRYEDGFIKNVSTEKLDDFAEALGVDPAYLMGWIDENDNWRGTGSYPNEDFGLGQRIKKLRESKKISQKEFAFKAGISLKLIEELESRIFYSINFSEVKQMAKVLEVNPWEIAGCTPIFWDTPMYDDEQIDELIQAYDKADLKSKNIVRTVLDLEPIKAQPILTIAAHKDNDEWTKDAKQDVENFKKLVKDKKNNK